MNNRNYNAMNKLCFYYFYHPNMKEFSSLNGKVMENERNVNLERREIESYE